MTAPADVSFTYIPEPTSFFYDLRVCFGERCEIVGGFDPGGGPDSDLARAALWLLTGGGPTHFRMDPVQPWGVRLGFRAVPLDRRLPSGFHEWGCEISRVDLDGVNEPETEPEVLGVTPSILQFAHAVLAYVGQPQRGSPSHAVLALRAALPLIEEAEAALGR